MTSDSGPDERRPMTQARLWFERIEALYLVILRVTVLIAATALLVWAAWLGLSGLYKLSRSPESVRTETAVVSTEEVLKLPAAALASSEAGSQAGAVSVVSAEAAYYKRFVDRYFALFNKYYAPYRRPEDTALTREAFDRAFVNSAQRLAMIKDGELFFTEDSALLEKMLAAVEAASSSDETVKRLRIYKSAVRVKQTVSVSKTRAVRQCSYYSYYYGCLTFETHYQPYTENVVVENLPKGVIGYAKLLQTYQNTFVSTLKGRQESLDQKADSERASITLGRQIGAIKLATAIKVVGAFLALMFFFLLVAIERHQRRLSAILRQSSAGLETLARDRLA